MAKSRHLMSGNERNHGHTSGVLEPQGRIRILLENKQRFVVYYTAFLLNILKPKKKYLLVDYVTNIALSLSVSRLTLISCHAFLFLQTLFINFLYI